MGEAEKRFERIQGIQREAEQLYEEMERDYLEGLKERFREALEELKNQIREATTLDDFDLKIKAGEVKKPFDEEVAELRGLDIYGEAESGIKDIYGEIYLQLKGLLGDKKAALGDEEELRKRYRELEAIEALTAPTAEDVKTAEEKEGRINELSKYISEDLKSADINGLVNEVPGKVAAIREKYEAAKKIIAEIEEVTIAASSQIAAVGERVGEIIEKGEYSKLEEELGEALSTRDQGLDQVKGLDAYEGTKHSTLIEAAEEEMNTEANDVRDRYLEALNAALVALRQMDKKDMRPADIHKAAELLAEIQAAQSEARTDEVGEMGEAEKRFERLRGFRESRGERRRCMRIWREII